MKKNFITDKQLKKIDLNIKKGKRTIMVEGPADKCVYKRFYPDSSFIFGNGCNEIIEKMRDWNSKYGKNPLFVAIIDSDNKPEKTLRLLSKENIFSLKLREIESIFLQENVIRKTFGDEFFEKFSQSVQLDAAKRVTTEVSDYNEAINILKKLVTSKYCIRTLVRTLEIRSGSNSSNIGFLCNKMDQANSWTLIEEFIPTLESTEYGENPNNKKRFQQELRNFTPLSTNYNQKKSESETARDGIEPYDD